MRFVCFAGIQCRTKIGAPWEFSVFCVCFIVFFCTLNSFPHTKYFLCRKLVSLPWKCAFSRTIPMPEEQFGGRCARVENLLVVHFKQMGLESGFTCSSLLNVSYFMRHRIPDKRSRIGKEAMSRCFGLNMQNV